MAVRDVIPTTNVKIQDIIDTLNAHGGSIVPDTSGLYDLTDLFSTFAAINKWSKYKPVVYASTFVDSDKRWQGDGNCGFSFPNSSNYADIPGWYNPDGSVGMNGWVYNIPTGGSSAPMRLGDFRGYCVYEYPITQGFHCPEKVSRATGSSAVCMCMANTESEYGLAMSDIPALSSCYFGIYAVCQGSTGVSRLVFAPTAGTVSVTVLTAGLTLGEWRFYPFFASAGSHASGTKYFPVPNVGFRKVTVVDSLDAIEVQITGEINQSTATCTFRILAKNTGIATALSTNAVYLKLDGNDLSDSLVTGEKSTSIGSLSIPSSSSFVEIHTGTFTGLSDTLMATGKLWLTMASGKYTDNVSPMKTPAGQLSIIE